MLSCSALFGGVELFQVVASFLLHSSATQPQSLLDSVYEEGSKLCFSMSPIFFNSMGTDKIALLP